MIEQIRKCYNHSDNAPQQRDKNCARSKIVWFVGFIYKHYIKPSCGICRQNANYQPNYRNVSI